MSLPGWIDGMVLNGIRVEKHELRRPGGQAYLKLDPDTRTAINHETQGSSVSGALVTLGNNFSGPHFVVGDGRIVQTRPLWAQAATVRGDNSRAIQIEHVGFSKQALHLPDDSTLRPAIALFEWFRDGPLDIPARRPDGWRDDCSDMPLPWAVETNERRLSRRAVGFAGHVMHLEWPDNTHWDNGAWWWNRIFELMEEPDMAILSEEDQRKLKNFLAALDGELDPSEGINAGALGRRVGRSVKKTEAPAESTSGITLQEADARYVLKGEPVIVTRAQ